VQNRIYLIGMPGCGKSSTGKKLAKELNWNWIDLDVLIEKNTGISIAQFFETWGEPAFREEEQKTLFSCQPNEPTVIACGGGTPAFGNNMEFINKHGLSVYLRANESFLWDRLSAKKQTRPLLAGLSEEECRIKITNLLNQRKSFYELAKVQIDLPYNSIKTLKNSILSHLESDY
jgi:shikimate kinase